MAFDYSASFAGINGAFQNIGKQNERAYERGLLARLGEPIKRGDFEGAAQAAFEAGDVQTGIGLLSLGQKRKELQQTEDAYKNSPFSNGGGMGTPRSPVAPAARAVGTPVVAAPKQGVHVAETEEDVQRLERATGMVTTDADKQAIVKTVYGEAANQPAVGQQAVAAVIRNRANQAGLTPEQITQQRNQFEPWNTEAGRARMNSIPEQRFAQIAGTVAPVIEQGLDPTGGATHFYAPKAQAALGRPAPRWDNGTGNDIADHRFFSLGYGQGGGTPAPSPQAIIASAPQEGVAPVQTAQAPAGPPVQPVPGDDPVRLRQDAQFYAQTNPEAARQLNARADAAERSGGVQTAQAAPPPGAPVPDAQNQPAPGAAEAQFTIPGKATLPPNDPYPQVSDQQLIQVWRNPRSAPGDKALAETIWKNRQAYAADTAPDKREQTRLETEKKAQEVEKLKRENLGVLTPEQEQQKIRIARAGRPINEPALPPGYKAIRDPEGNIERLEPIPGSKAEQEATATAEKKVKADRIKGEVGTTVGNALDDIDRLMSSATLPTSGALGARLANIPGTAAHDISQALTTVGANISFSQLQQMREASPTGGALGAVSDTEQKLLQNSYAALSQSQTPDQFKTNLGRVRATFERIVHGRVLTGQERKTGGPMTMERAKGLREEAAAAIASGAPRDAVMKRLKEDYGITPEGL